ncbi:hypothetical protein QYE76_015219 [Lolium multiflorum]|uniref:Uncharacterized protein n=1 Tax=Lolium multiflorum TaxID=4521 RepID=A0AAD8X908_LOLMU|nr:hypothetical protein QYE76_015219 [Lolium multiflorum]
MAAGDETSPRVRGPPPPRTSRRMELPVAHLDPNVSSNVLNPSARGFTPRGGAPTISSLNKGSDETSPHSRGPPPPASSRRAELPVAHVAPEVSSHLLNPSARGFTPRGGAAITSSLNKGTDETSPSVGGPPPPRTSPGTELPLTLVGPDVSSHVLNPNARRFTPRGGATTTYSLNQGTDDETSPHSRGPPPPASARRAEIPLTLVGPNASSHLLNPSAREFTPRGGAAPASSLHQGTDDESSPRVRGTPPHGTSRRTDLPLAPVGHEASSHVLNENAREFKPRGGGAAAQPYSLNLGAGETFPRVRAYKACFVNTGPGAEELEFVVPVTSAPRATSCVMPDLVSMPVHSFTSNRLDTPPQRMMPELAAMAGHPSTSSNGLDTPPQRQVRAVWRDNCAKELGYLSYLLNQGRPALLGIDTEYVAPAPEMEQVGPPQSASEWYHRLRSLVNTGDIVQLGFAFQFDDDSNHNVPHVFEINLKVSPDLRSYNPRTLEFLKKVGHKLENNARQGVTPQILQAWLKEHLQKLTASTVLMFQGDYDSAFLLRLALENYQLPWHQVRFLQDLRDTVRTYYDVRVLGLQLLKFEEKRFSLTKLGSALGIQRFGNEHGSGSDALLTLDCFAEIRRRLGTQLKPLAKVLCGLYSNEEVVRWSIPLHADNLKLVEVWVSNFNENASLLLSSARSNFTIFSIHAELYPAQRCTESCDDEYTRLGRLVPGVTTAKFAVAIGSEEGQLAAGQSYMFNVCFDDKPRQLENGNKFVPAQEFGAVVISHLLSRQEIKWTTFKGAETVACIFRCMEGGLPAADQYLPARSTMFPTLFDIAVITEHDNSTVNTICEGCSIQTENSNGDKENTAILIARCFLRILEVTEPLVLEKSNGYLL